MRLYILTMTPAHHQLIQSGTDSGFFLRGGFTTKEWVADWCRFFFCCCCCRIPVVSESCRSASTNNSKCKRRNEAIRIRSNSQCDLLKAREKSCAQVSIGFGFPSHWLILQSLLLTVIWNLLYCVISWNQFDLLLQKCCVSNVWPCCLIIIPCACNYYYVNHDILMSTTLNLLQKRS